MSKKSVGKQLDEDFDIIFTPDGDLDFEAQSYVDGDIDGDKDYVMSGMDVNELIAIMYTLKDVAPELAVRIETIINNVVEI